MNFETVKIEFLLYLKENFQAFNTLNAQDLCNEFKNYINTQSTNQNSIFTESNQIEQTENLNDECFDKEIEEVILGILSENNDMGLDIESISKIIQEEFSKIEGEESVSDDTIEYIDEIDKSTTDTQEDNIVENNILTNINNDKNSELSDMLNEIYNNKDIIKILDQNDDQDLDDKEKEKFEEYVKNFYGDSENLTLDDLKSAMKDITDGKFSYENKKEPEKTNSKETEKIDKVHTPKGTGGSQKYNNYSNNDLVNNNNDPDNNKTPVDLSKLSTSNMDLNQLNEYKTKYIQPTIIELKSTITEQQKNVNTAQTKMEETKNQTQEEVNSAEEEYTLKENEYKKALNKDSYLNSDEGKELKDKIIQNLKEIDGAEIAQSNAMNSLNESITNRTSAYENVNNCTNNVMVLQSAITQIKGTISGLENALATYSNVSADNTEATTKKDELQTKLEQARSELESKEEELTKANTALSSAKDELQNAEQQVNTAQTEYDTATQNLEKANLVKEALDKEVNIISDKLDEKTIKAKNRYDTAKEVLDKTRQNQKENISAAENNLKNAQETLKSSQELLVKATAELDKVNAEINKKESEKQYKISSIEIDVDLEENLNSIQKQDLERVKQIYKKNKETYQEISDIVFEKTGLRVPPEAICAIHYRESDNDFTTYLHNGEKLGKTTKLVPAGIFFTDFKEAAADAITRELDSTYLKSSFSGTKNIKRDLSTLSSVLLFTERYNGFGARKKGGYSSYVYAGTTQYNNDPNSGRYYADHKFTTDKDTTRLGTYSIIKELMQV